MDKYKEKKSKKAMMISVLGSAIITTSLFSGCKLFPDEGKAAVPTLIEAKEIDYKTVFVSKKSIVQKSSCSGEIVPIKYSEVYLKNRGGYLKNVFVKPGDKVKKGDILAELESFHVENEIEKQEYVIEKAKIIRDEIKGTTNNQFELKKAQLDLEVEKCKLRQLKNQLNESKITAPSDGEITYYSDFNVGEKINLDDKLFIIGDTSEIVIEIKSKYLNKYKKNMGVDILYTDKELNKRTYEGYIFAIGSDDESIAKDKGIIKFNEEAEDIEINSPVTLKIKVDEKENVLTIPQNVIYYEAGKEYVYVVKDGVREMRNITTGIKDSNDIEILEGLQEGEEIAKK